MNESIFIANDQLAANKDRRTSVTAQEFFELP